MKRIFVHHSADNQKEPQFWKVNDYHKHKFGEKSNLGFWVGYNKFIEKNGVIMTARQDGEMTVAQKGDNYEALSVCLAGDFNQEVPTKSQEIALISVLDAWMKDYAISFENVRLHRDLNKDTECPGKNITIGFIRALINQNIAKKENPIQISLMEQIIGKLKAVVAVLRELIKIKK